MKSDIKENRPSCLRFVFPSNVRVQLVISYFIKLSWPLKQNNYFEQS